MTEVDCEEEIYEQARDTAGDYEAHVVLDERMLEHLKEAMLKLELVKFLAKITAEERKQNETLQINE